MTRLETSMACLLRSLLNICTVFKELVGMNAVH